MPQNAAPFICLHIIKPGTSVALRTGTEVLYFLDATHSVNSLDDKLTRFLV